MASRQSSFDKFLQFFSSLKCGLLLLGLLGIAMILGTFILQRPMAQEGQIEQAATRRRGPGIAGQVGDRRGDGRDRTVEQGAKGARERSGQKSPAGTPAGNTGAGNEGIRRNADGR